MIYTQNPSGRFGQYSLCSPQHRTQAPFERDHNTQIGRRIQLPTAPVPCIRLGPIRHRRIGPEMVQSSLNPAISCRAKYLSTSLETGLAPGPFDELRAGSVPGASPAHILRHFIPRSTVAGLNIHSRTAITATKSPQAKNPLT